MSLYACGRTGFRTCSFCDCSSNLFRPSSSSLFFGSLFFSSYYRIYDISRLRKDYCCLSNYCLRFTSTRSRNRLVPSPRRRFRFILQFLLEAAGWHTPTHRALSSDQVSRNHFCITRMRTAALLPDGEMRLLRVSRFYFSLCFIHVCIFHRRQRKRECWARFAVPWSHVPPLNKFF